MVKRRLLPTESTLSQFAAAPCVSEWDYHSLHRILKILSSTKEDVQDEIAKRPRRELTTGNILPQYAKSPFIEEWAEEDRHKILGALEAHCEQIRECIGIDEPTAPNQPEAS